MSLLDLEDKFPRILFDNGWVLRETRRGNSVKIDIISRDLEGWWSEALARKKICFFIENVRRMSFNFDQSESKISSNDPLFNEQP